VLEGIEKNASQTQVDILVEYPALLYQQIFAPHCFWQFFFWYECALLQHKLTGIPVVPVYVAEIVNNGGINKFKPFDFSKVCSIPDTSHARGQHVQGFIDDLRFVFTYMLSLVISIALAVGWGVYVYLVVRL
jgi:hypothetical protein